MQINEKLKLIRFVKGLNQKQFAELTEELPNQLLQDMKVEIESLIILF